jgi:hypothetical protein
MTFAEWTELTRTIAISASSVFAGTSIGFAVYQYVRGEQKKQFNAVRDSLAEIRNAIQTTDTLLSDVLSAECSEHLANRLTEINDLSGDIASLREFFTTDGNLNFILRAIALCRSDCRSIDNLQSQLKQIDSIPTQFSDQFPILSAAMQHLSVMIKIAAELHESMELYSDALVSPSFWDSATKYLEKDVERFGTPMAFRMLLTALSSSSVAKVQPMIDAASEMIDLIVDAYTNMSDKEMRKQSKRERKLSAKLEEVDYTTAIDDAMACVAILRDNSLAKQWPDVRDASGRLKSAYYRISDENTEDDK